MPLFASARPSIEIGLVNNMPDAALHATERQFAGLLKAAGERYDVRLRFYSLPEIPRGEHTRTYMRAIYDDFGQMFDAGLDGLIVTGAEPRADDLTGESYWGSLTHVIDWAEANVAASYWSCLAAHAAVRRLDGINRVRLDAKLSGVFDIEAVAEDRLLARLPKRICTPHSRLNGLDEPDLAAHGYSVLTRSTEAGVDTFVRRGRSLMMFGQGHPEYDADTLLREYCRDAGRYLCGKRDAPPAAPSRYLNQRTQQALEAVARRGRDHALMARYNAIAAMATPKQGWRPTAVALFRNWLSHIAAAKTAATRTSRRAGNRALTPAQA